MILFLIFILIPISCYAKLHFMLNILDSNCFFEELPQNTLVQGKYLLEYWNSSLNQHILADSTLGLHVTVHDKEEKSILMRTYTTKGLISFTSSAGGEYTICLQAIKTKNNVDSIVNKLRVTFSLKSGSHNIVYDTVAKEEKLNDLEIRVRKLLDQTKDIAKEQEYQRMREERFRVTSENTRWHLMMWIFLQLLTLAILCFWQARHLTAFFVKKKLL